MADAPTPPSPPTSPSEKRRESRFRSRMLLEGEVQRGAKEGGRSFLGSTVNVSGGGALVRTYEPLPVGTELDLKIHLPDGDFDAHARVMHARKDAIGCTLLGVRFLQAQLNARLLLEKFLHACSSALPKSAAPTEGAGSGVEVPALPTRVVLG